MSVEPLKVHVDLTVLCKYFYLVITQKLHVFFLT